MTNEPEVEKYLECIRDTAKSHPIIDAHVHPFEVIFGGMEYLPNPDLPGLFSAGNTSYAPPSAGAWETPGNTGNSPGPGNRLRARIPALFLRRLYLHTGPKCLGDQMDLAGISKAILLPVSRPGEEIDSQVRLMMEMFGADPRFAIGCGVPDKVEPERIGFFIKRAVREYGIRIIKIHPNISKIDPVSGPGRKRMEAILAASRDCRLKVMIHGGASPLLKLPERNYATIQNLKEIDFAITDQPVILSHACTFGHKTAEVLEIMPLLDKLLARHANLMVDISATEFEALCLVLKNVDHQRIVFGSDALYEQQWRTVVKLMHALKLAHGDYLEKFIRITSVNSLELFRKEFEHDPGAESKILSIR